MKKLLILVLTFFVFHSLQAQDLELTFKEEIIQGDDSDFELISHATVKNNTEESLQLDVKIKIINLIPGHEVAYCTHLCFGAQTTDWESGWPFDINAGETSDDVLAGGFSAHLYPNGNTGTSTIEFEFFDVNTPSRNASYTVEFQAGGVSVTENYNHFNTKMYPLPANDVINIRTDGISGSELYIYNAKGNMLKSVNNDAAGIVQVNLTEFSEGVYFIKDEKGNSGKFVISR
ncbi:MAG: T9SS type A sorting domain-containing protein [Candidatus Kapaibacterium sp.]